MLEAVARAAVEVDLHTATRWTGFAERPVRARPVACRPRAAAEEHRIAPDVLFNDVGATCGAAHPNRLRRQGSGFLMIGVPGTCEETAATALLDHHRVTLRAHLITQFAAAPEGRSHRRRVP